MIVHLCKKVVNGSERCDKNIQRDYRDSLSIRECLDSFCYCSTTMKYYKY